MTHRTAALGIFSRRERWGLSLRGALILCILGVVGSAGASHFLLPFLAVTSKAPARILVMEGWLHPDVVEVAAREFRTGGYELLVTTGGPFPGGRGIPGDANTWADSGAYWLRTAGIDRSLIISVPTHVVSRDRTFESAVALSKWLKDTSPNYSAINVITQGAHARRTRLLFQKAVDDKISVGIIAIPNPDFDSAQWWRYSEGVREVLGETIAYLYARLIFRVPPRVRGR
jgi:uncharacterized SAM-binding protein YcdF (DUF218 family)